VHGVAPIFELKHCRSALLVVAVAAMTGACASTRATPRPFPMPGPRPQSTPPPVAAVPEPPAPTTPEPGRVDGQLVGEAPAAVPPAVDVSAVAVTALMLRGIPYRNGGTDPRGFDCSGFTQYVFAQYGISLPRAVAAQYEVGTAVELEAIAPGDLLFFTTVAPGASHVGIAIGDGQFVHAPSSTGVVRVERASSSYWGPRFLAARRVLTQSSGAP
jgi:cell wall-associated NlpC family hydrolase